MAKDEVLSADAIKQQQSFFEQAHKPFDIVSNDKGSVGFIQEVSINSGQLNEEKFSYAVCWLTGDERKTAWFDHDELNSHCNLFVKMAQKTCHPAGNNSKHVKSLLGAIK